MIERTLCHDGQTQDEKIVLSQTALKEKTQPLVILGEAGMGKSHLLAWLSEDPRYALCTASQFINRHEPRTLLGEAEVLVIDALDEVVAQRDGDGLDHVLRQLGKAGYPCFVLSCRVADWRSAIGRKAISEQYELPPLELHLNPFSDQDAARFLGVRLGEPRAVEVIAHYNARGLQGLLGNPQTLEMIADVADGSELPDTKAQLFARSIDVLGCEHKDIKAEHQLVPELAISTAGAAFASLILTGQEAIVRKAGANAQIGELLLASVARLPGAQRIAEVLGTRLFKARGSDRFSYCHRRIAEFQAARWLAALADTSRKRRRLLSLFHRQGVVPASLRGLHAWLAQDAFLAEAVILADPMGVIEYGGADALDAKQARALLDGLIRLAAENPNFYGWGGHSLRGLARTELCDELRTQIFSPDTCFGLRMILLEAIAGSAIAQALATDLLSLVLDDKKSYAIRSRAADALIQSGSTQSWASHVKQLAASGDEQSIRLALNLLHDVGHSAFDDYTIADTVMAEARRAQRTFGSLWQTRKQLPAERAEGILEHFLTMARALGDARNRPGNYEITRFAYHLIALRLKEGAVDPLLLWSWLSPFAHQLVASKDTSAEVVSYLKANPDARCAILRHVLLNATDEKDVWERCWALSRASLGLCLSHDDIIDLLGALQVEDAADTRWQALVRMAQHQGSSGADVRKAARRFTSDRPDLQSWLDALANPPVPQWEIEEREWKRQREAERKAERDQQRSDYLARIDSMQAGEFEALVDPAQAYLKLFFDLGNDIPAHQRIEEWLGPELAEAAHAGFEAFLTTASTAPTALQIAEAHAENQIFYAGHILIAAIAERRRNGQGLDDLSDERLLACLFSHYLQHIEQQTDLKGLNGWVEEAVRARGLWPQAMRMLFEPRLTAGNSSRDGLYELMQSEYDAELASDLAIEWLRRFPTLPESPEMELADRLLRRGLYHELRALMRDRTVTNDPARARRWLAIGLIVDFERTQRMLESSPIEPELLWSLRDLTAPRSNRNQTILLDTAQRAWIVATFRDAWQNQDDRAGQRGNESPWDAAQYLRAMIQQLGNDTSEAAVDALRTLCDSPADSYTSMLRVVVSEQTRKRVDALYVPPTLEAVAAVLNDLPPASGDDLQAYLLEALEIVGKKVRSDDVDSWRGFYDDDGAPHDEERCRDHLIGLLRQEAQAIAFDPEGHVASDKEIDIACKVGALLMPIEVKGQWHDELWVAADQQLDRLYTPDWRADGYGIYLVLWFGDNVPKNKKLKSPGRASKRPSSPQTLRDQLIERSRAAKTGRVSVVVLDLSRIM
jgi:hypothetical protein